MKDAGNIEELAVALQGVADDDPGFAGKLLEQRRHRLAHPAADRRTQQQVLRRVARERQFRKHQHRRVAATHGLARDLHDATGVAGKVTHNRVDLGHQDVHDATGLRVKPVLSAIGRRQASAPADRRLLLESAP